MQVFLSYPSWFILFCVALAFIYSFLLYYKQRQPETLQKPIRYLLSLTRFLASFTIAFLLLAPFVKRHFTKTEKPIIVFVEDNSTSINYAFKKTDSNQYFKNLLQLKSILSANYEIKSYSFEDKLDELYKQDFKGKSTNISKSLEDVHDLYFNRNIGAVILASDGIYNRGISPLNSEASNSYPIYTILIGDTTQQKDAKITNCLYNEIVYLNDQFEIKTDISSFNCMNKNATISIEEIGLKGIKSSSSKQTILYNQVQDQKTLSFILQAKQPGLIHYRISHSAIEGEYTLENNVKDIFIQVLDGRDKILLVAEGPHPDISAIKQAIDKNKNYSLEIKYANETISKIDEYNLVILHQIPSNDNYVNSLLNELKSKNIATWFILGTNSNVYSLSKHIGIVEFSKIRNSFNDIHAIANKDFTLFNMDPKYLETIAKLPPLNVPYGEFKSNQSNTLLTQKVGAVSTNYPLLCMGEAIQQKQAVLMGEGIWRWRIYNYMLHQNFDAVDDLILKTIQYLSVKGDKRKFKTNLTKTLFDENENIKIDAQLYNDNYQLINTCDVSLVLIDENNTKYNYTFSKTANAYTLDLGKLKNGTYSYEAMSSCNGKTYKDNGKFSVKAIQLEAISISADDDLLYALSKKKNAEMVYANDLIKLAELIKNKKEIKPIIYDSYKTDSIIHIKFLFFMILFLLSVEWIVRKYLGLY